ncbi:MAG TPA: phosphoribosyl-ATP diphosphatase [Beijerinckiaceae bacterium]|nr:phosphoribosyl-ATP diphosphatase [Beijerinckiaceae bacterium]
MPDSIQSLYMAILKERRRSPMASRTAKLLSEGTVKIAKKLAEEAVEVGHEAMLKRKAAVIAESADVLYNLAVLWVDAGTRPADVWAEMKRREAMLGIAEKLPKEGQPVRPRKREKADKSAKEARPVAPQRWALRRSVHWLRLGHNRTNSRI